MTISINQATSFEYLIGSTLDNNTYLSLQRDIASSPSSIIILGNGGSVFGGYDQVLNRSIADPNGNKLIFDYIDLTEASEQQNPELFSNGALPSWFGAKNTSFPNLYSVQFWNPLWRTALFTAIDKEIKQGFDGIFLDVATGYEWTPGNSFGNPVHSTASQDAGSLISAIRSHINSLNLGRPFYLIANMSGDVASAAPTDVKSLDAIFNEIVYYRQDPKDYTKTYYAGDALAGSVSSAAAIYKNIGVPVLGNDYPTSLNDVAADFKSFAFYSNLGWLPSVNNSSVTSAVLSTGPFMFMATAATPSVTGAQSFVNFLSGGLAPTASLAGGDKGDFFIGGPGSNTIKGGAGSDTIYAHPQSALADNQLSIQFYAHNTTQYTPTISIKINGTTATQDIPVSVMDTQTDQVQTLSVDLAKFGLINSIEIDPANLHYVDSSHLSWITLTSIRFEGQPVNFDSGTYSQFNASFGTSANLDANGSVVFSGNALPARPAQLANTSDTIDGGGGVNTVIYRSNAADFTITAQPGHTWLASTTATAEGPDTLSNIQVLTFADQTLYLPDAALTDAATAVLRVQPMATATQSTFSGLAQQVQAGSLTDAAAVAQVIKTAGSTASVATLAYEFFTGSAPSAGGMDYLVSPTGPNPNNLNAPYYQHFSLENRYINFAVNLGKVGAGAAAFQAGYGSLSLSDAMSKAYTTIFGTVPTAAKVDTLLNAMVPDGLGGQETRAQYFAFYGLDGVTGIGTKAAMVGWLLGEAVKADVGDYALSNDAFLTAIAAGTGKYGVDLIGQYDKASYHYTGG